MLNAKVAGTNERDKNSFFTGNTAYMHMVPPPNIIQQTQPPPPHQHNIIFQTAPPQLQQLQLHQSPNLINSNNLIETNATSNNEDPIKEERNSPEPSENDSKTEEKSETENVNNEISLPNTQLAPPPMLQQPPPSLSLSQHLQMRPSNQITSTTNITQGPPPIMAAPPPISCVQHIVGNTLITSQPAQTQTHQIYNHIPVSIQPHQQQIHVSAPNGQHFLVNAQQWQQSQQQFQQVTQNGNPIQSIQLTATQPINHNGQSQQILTTTYNPHVPAPAVSGMQLQLQPIQTTQQITQSMQSIENHHSQHQHHQIIDQQQTQTYQQQTQIINSVQQPPLPPPVSINYSMDNGQQKLNGLIQANSQSIQYIHQPQVI